MGILILKLYRMERNSIRPINFEELIEGLLELFSNEKEGIVIEDVQTFFNRYVFNPADIAKYAKWDKYKYTRNLMHEGNSKFNLILMCWPEGIASPIHDHADSHCFMRILDGDAKETRFFWPRQTCNPDGSLIEMTSRSVPAGVTAYMSDELGLHRIENASHTNKLCFYSKYGQKEDVKGLVAAKSVAKIISG